MAAADQDTCIRTNSGSQEQAHKDPEQVSQEAKYVLIKCYWHLFNYPANGMFPRTQGQDKSQNLEREYETEEEHVSQLQKKTTEQVPQQTE